MLERQGFVLQAIENIVSRKCSNEDSETPGYVYTTAMIAVFQQHWEMPGDQCKCFQDWQHAGVPGPWANG